MTRVSALIKEAPDSCWPLPCEDTASRHHSLNQKGPSPGPEQARAWVLGCRDPAVRTEGPPPALTAPGAQGQLQQRRGAPTANSWLLLYLMQFKGPYNSVNTTISEHDCARIPGFLK